MSTRKKLSENFYEDEFTCKCGCGKTDISDIFVIRLQGIRTALGKPMKITSGYRCPEWNAKVGGVENSYHVQGKAVDIAIPSNAYQYQLIRFAINHGICGIGASKNGRFVHLDARPKGQGKERFWLYD